MEGAERIWDVIIIGAGPAGMSAAEVIANAGFRVIVVDEQPAPGGQIWRGIERRKDDAEGVAAVGRFRSCDASYLPETRMWQLEPLESGQGWRVYLAGAGRAFWRECRILLLATGAYERPSPLPDWTLPGVLTVGGAQILLKTSLQIPDEPVWIAGAGPLPLLYMVQLLKNGGRIAGYLDTSPKGGLRRSLSLLWPALRADWRGLLRGLGWQARLRFAGVRVWRGATDISAQADSNGGSLREVSFRDAAGRHRRARTSVLLLHRGLLPVTDASRAVGCAHDWVESQGCFAPKLDEWGMTSRDDLFVTGDGAGIGGADAAVLRGRLTALGILLRLRGPEEMVASTDYLHQADVIRTRLARLLHRQHFIDALYPPPGIDDVGDDVLVCRCEEVRAGTLRAAIAEFPDGGPDEIKIRTRCGMGACQGRQCGDALAGIFATARGKSMADVGIFRVRPPIRPLSFTELATLGVPEPIAKGDLNDDI